MMAEQLGIIDIVTILLVTIGPLKALIVYASLTAEADVDFRRQVAIRTVKTAAIVSLVFVLAGEILLRIFHVSLPALKIAGGIILLLFALGMVMGGRRDEWLEPARLLHLFRDTAPERHYKILDTSVIIDGRIADVCETGFIDGTLVVPQFVLKELQFIADSADSLKRNRGRRGLDILARIQKMSGVHVTISDVDFPDVREVDLKLIELGKQLDAVIVTNDFNLNKVAQLRGVNVLNINELANALKPVVLPGEAMRVFILKEGKEYNQGVAYLDDGTMVVVDNARRLIGKNADIAVTSVLQTTAGKMIFGKIWDEPENGSGNGERTRRPLREVKTAAGLTRINDTET